MLCSKSHTVGQIVGVLALNRGVTSDKLHVNRDTLQQDLSLDCDGDLHVVLAFAEKIRTNTYFDVLETLRHIVKQSLENLRLCDHFYECVCVYILLNKIKDVINVR